MVYLLYNFMVIFHGELLVTTRGYVDIKIVPGPPAFIHHPKVPNCSQQGMKPATGFNNQLQPSHQVCDLAVGSDIVHPTPVRWPVLQYGGPKLRKYVFFRKPLWLKGLRIFMIFVLSHVVSTISLIALW